MNAGRAAREMRQGGRVHLSWAPLAPGLSNFERRVLARFGNSLYGLAGVKPGDGSTEGREARAIRSLVQRGVIGLNQVDEIWAKKAGLGDE